MKGRGQTREDWNDVVKKTYWICKCGYDTRRTTSKPLFNAKWMSKQSLEIHKNTSNCGLRMK